MARKSRTAPRSGTRKRSTQVAAGGGALGRDGALEPLALDRRAGVAAAPGDTGMLAEPTLASGIGAQGADTPAQVGLAAAVGAATDAVTGGDHGATHTAPRSEPARRPPATLGQTASRLAVPPQGLSSGSLASPPRSQQATLSSLAATPTVDGRGPGIGPRMGGVSAPRGPRASTSPTSPRGTAGPGRARPGVPTNPDLAAERAAGLTAEALALTRQDTLAFVPELTAAAEAMEESRASAETGTPSGMVLIRGTRPARAGHGAARIVPRRLRPHSPLTLAAVALVTLAALAGALTVTSPLGRSASIASALESYANAVAWIPTPTPTPKPTPPPAPGPQTYPSSPGTQAVINEIKQVFGPYSAGALGVANCESGFDPHAWNPISIGGSHAEGVFQILYPSTWDGTSYAGDNPYDANANIHAAYQIFARDGYSWREWQCQP